MHIEVTGPLGPYFWYYLTARESQAPLGASSLNTMRVSVD